MHFPNFPSIPWPSSRSIPLGIGMAILTGTGVYFILNRRAKPVDLSSLIWEDVGVVSDLTIYPVKSAGGISVKNAKATKLGLQQRKIVDRSFIVFTEVGMMVTGREAPLLTTIKTELSATSLSLTALDGNKISIDLSNLVGKENVKLSIRNEPAEGVDCGDLIADWLSATIFPDKPKKVRLFYYICPSPWVREMRKLNYFNFPTIKEGDTTIYMDCAAFNVASSSSLSELNSRLERPVRMNFFRPPIVVGGSIPWDEDNWEYMRIGEEIILRTVKPCERCTLTTIDPGTGRKRRDHLEEMLKYRRVTHPKALATSWASRPIFGLHCGIEKTGEIKVGDAVKVSRAKNNYWRC